MQQKLSTAAADAPGVGSHTSTFRAYLAMAAATFLWASNAVAVKLTLREVPQLATVALRITLAAITLAIIQALQRGRFHLRKNERANILKLSLSGLALSFFCYTTGLNYTSVSHAVFVNALTPIAVLLIAWAQRLEKITPYQIAGLLLSLGGVLALALDKSGGQAGWRGDLLVVGSVTFFAYFTVGSKKVALSHPTLEFNTFAFLAAALWFLPLLAAELPFVPWKQVTWVGWSSLLYSAVFGSAGAYLTYYYSLRVLPASRVAAFHYLQPILATIFGVIIFRDRFTPRFIVGAALILAGLFVARQYRVAQPEEAI